MNTGQMFLVLGAAVLLALVGQTIGDILWASDRAGVESQAGTQAVAVADERMADVLDLQFDTIVTGSSIDTIGTTAAAFVCSTHVGYVEDTAPNTEVVGPTSLKRVSVSVASEHTPGSITLVAIACDL